VADAVDQYLKAYVDAYGKLGAEWIVVHAGYHFTSDKEMRMEAGLERLTRVVEYAEKKHALIVLENLNKEPADAEVHYLARTRARSGDFTSSVSSRRRSSSRSRSTTRISFRKGSPALSTHSI
jgi:hypothetical protein